MTHWRITFIPKGTAMQRSTRSVPLQLDPLFTGHGPSAGANWYCMCCPHCRWGTSRTWGTNPLAFNHQWMHPGYSTHPNGVSLDFQKAFDSTDYAGWPMGTICPSRLAGRTTKETGTTPRYSLSDLHRWSHCRVPFNTGFTDIFWRMVQFRIFWKTQDQSVKKPNLGPYPNGHQGVSSPPELAS